MKLKKLITNSLVFYLLFMRTNTNLASPVALENCGEGCFFNAVVQCLYNKKDLTDLLLLPETKKIYKPGSLALAYVDLVNHIHAAQDSSMPEDWIDAIHSLKVPIYSTSGQYSYSSPGITGDSNEVLRELLDGLADIDIDESKSTEFYGFPYVLQPKTNISTLLNFIDVEYHNTNTKGCTEHLSSGFIYQMIQLNTAKSITNHSTGEIKYEPFKTLNECFKFGSENEFEESQNPFDSNSPKCKIISLRKFITLPKTLIIALDRIVPTALKSADVKKLKHGVDFEHDLDMTPFVSTLANKNLQTKYELTSFVVQHGEGPDYTAYIKSEKKWYQCHYSLIKGVSGGDVSKIISAKDEELSDTPNILFYEQLPQKKALIKAPTATVAQLNSALGKPNKDILDKYLKELTEEEKLKQELTLQDFANGINDQLITVDYVRRDFQLWLEAQISSKLKLQLPEDRQNLSKLTSQLEDLSHAFSAVKK